MKTASQKTSIALHAVSLAILCASCRQAPSANVDLFKPGESGDPVLAMALTQTSNVTLQAGAGNWETSALTQGLITLSPVVTAGQTASAAVQSYVKSSSATAGDAKTLATALGLSLGVNAWVLPAVAGGGDVEAIMLSAPSGSTLSYIARVAGTSADFVAYANLSTSSGAPAGERFFSYNLNASGVVQSGNTSLGATPDGGFGAANLTTSCTPSSSTMTYIQNFVDEDFTVGKNEALWPQNIGWLGDFNGDWYTDGTTVRVKNPKWAGSDPNAPSPTVTGFVKFIDICPPSTSGATLSFTADVDTSLYTDSASDTTLVLYYFDASNNVIRVDTSYALRKGNTKRIGIYDSAVPTTARKVAIVPMAYLPAGEQQTVFYSHLTVSYEPPNARTTTSIVSEGFSSYSTTTSGKNQPTGWTEFNGDWFVMSSFNFATLWNSKWGGDQTKLPPVDTGMVKSFSIQNKYQAGDTINARIFAALTFTDPTSFARLRLVFDDTAKTEIASDRFKGSGWGNIDVYRGAVPSGAKNVQVVVNAYLGPNETSSLYVDNLSVSLIH